LDYRHDESNRKKGVVGKERKREENFEGKESRQETILAVKLEE